jgi:hypothetical protein
MPAPSRDRFLPTAVGLVSRAWVVEQVERRVADPRQRAHLIDDLVAFEPPRSHGLRNMTLFWATAIGASAFADWLGFPAWTGFVAAVLLFLALARWLAVQALRWRLDQLLSADAQQPTDRGRDQG